MKSLVEIRPSNASQGHHRRKDATELMKNLTLARIRTQVPGFICADVLTTKPRVPVAPFTMTRKTFQMTYEIPRIGL